ncbi:MAG: polysaccharide deacetylase family protein [Saprospiraceae bacterium]|nr:polysaccharide deacetylase family protein [Saprospiraceae bacterium]
MKNLALLFLFLTLGLSAQKQVCFTIDDLPVVPYRHAGEAFEAKLTNKLLGHLVEENIPATGFVNEGKLFPNGSERLDTARYKLLRRWLEAGMDLGNHTYGHLDYNNVSTGLYFTHITQGERLTRPLTGEFGKSLRYFRHPYLHTGPRQGKADSLRAFLQERNYLEAPVTIDNEEYLYAFAYDSAMAARDTALMRTIGEAYVVYMEHSLHYYEQQSQKLFGRNIRHILLLHANALNADYLDELAAMYRRNGYDFITLDEALQDEAYQTEVTVFGRWGISWLHRWALSRGLKGDFFDGEPETQQFIRDLTR